MDEIVPVEGLETIYTKIPNEVYQQILKDVARSGSHISPTATEEETEHFQDQLTQIICWVLHRHPELKLVLLFGRFKKKKQQDVVVYDCVTSIF